MDSSTSRVLIQTYVQSKWKELKRYPERSIRNLVDMALHFSKGHFQKHFFETAQKMLHNRQSAYFPLIQNLLNSVSEERVISFAMNLGYNSFTEGAKKIRAAEAAYGFNIPWCISLTVPEDMRPEHLEMYSSIIRQGEKLGVYMWNFFAGGNAVPLLPLIERQKDCAFLLFCSPDDITEEFLGGAALSPHLMPVVRYMEGASGACRRLREKGFLYSVYMLYEEKDVPSIVNDELLYDIEALSPAFTFLWSASCPEALQKSVGDYAVRAREMQNHRTVLFDLLFDSRRIDHVISEDCCTAFFDAQGRLFSDPFHGPYAAGTFFNASLAEIFRAAFPKTKAPMQAASLSCSPQSLSPQTRVWKQILPAASGPCQESSGKMRR